MNSREDRIRFIENSLRCYAYGWCSLIPFVGLPLFVLALRAYQKTRVYGAGQWNPADRYLNWGMILATIGAFISATLFGVLILFLMNIAM